MPEVSARSCKASRGCEAEAACPVGMPMRDAGGMLKTIGGTLLLVLAAFIFSGFMLSEREDSTLVTVLSLVVAVGSPAALGISLLRSARRGAAKVEARDGAPRRIQRVQSPETEVLALASRREGRLTDVEASAQLGIPIEEVREHLESLVRKEVAEIEVTDSGQFVYSSPGFLTSDQKDDAKGLLEE